MRRASFTVFGSEYPYRQEGRARSGSVGDIGPLTTDYYKFNVTVEKQAFACTLVG